MTKFITIIIPTYNTGEGIFNLFNSIRNQSIGFDNVEVIFVDDASDDEVTLDILNELDCFDNVRVFYLAENSGFPGRGRNLGLSKATGEFVIFADHDDSYNEDAFKKMYEEIKSKKGDLIFTNYFNKINDKKIKNKTSFNGENIIIDNFSQDLRLFTLGPSIWTKLFRKDFLIKNNIKFLEGMLAEDLELYIHSLFLSKKTIYLDDFYSYNYSIRDTNADKSTIHLRNKLIFSKMIEGYFKVNELLINLNKEEYFDLIFKKHFVYFITSLIKSNISNDEKKQLLTYINPLLKKEFKFSDNLGERRYNKLTKYLAHDKYDKAVKELKNINRKNKLKSIFGRNR